MLIISCSSRENAAFCVLLCVFVTNNWKISNLYAVLILWLCVFKEENCLYVLIRFFIFSYLILFSFILLPYYLFVLFIIYPQKDQFLVPYNTGWIKFSYRLTWVDFITVSPALLKLFLSSLYPSIYSHIRM